MVRMKQRYILSEIVTSADVDQLSGLGKERLIVYPWKSSDIYHTIRQAVESSHGEYGLAGVQSSLSVKYLNAVTRIVMIRVKRGLHHTVIQAMTCVKNISNQSAFFRTLHVGGTIRSCEKFLVRFHYWQMPALLRVCSTEEERLKVEDSLSESLHNLQQHRISTS